MGEGSYVIVEYYISILLADVVSTKTTFRVSGDSEEKIVRWLIKISLTPLPLQHTLNFVIINGSNITSRIFRNTVIQQQKEAHTIHHQFTKHLNVINTPSVRQFVDCILKLLLISWANFSRIYYQTFVFQEFWVTLLFASDTLGRK